MPTKPGRPRSAAADQAIARATIKLLSEHGFSGTSMTGIAKAAGVSTATLYRRFNNLDEAIVSALAEQVQIYQIPDNGSIDEDLRAYLRDLARELSAGLGKLMSALIEAASRNIALSEALKTHVSDPGRKAVATMFERAIERGEIRGDIDLEVVIDLVSGPLYIRRLGQHRQLTRELADDLADLILPGLRPPS